MNYSSFPIPPVPPWAVGGWSLFCTEYWILNHYCTFIFYSIFTTFCKHTTTDIKYPTSRTNQSFVGSLLYYLASPTLPPWFCHFWVTRATLNLTHRQAFSSSTLRKIQQYLSLCVVRMAYLFQTCLLCLPHKPPAKAVTTPKISSSGDKEYR